MLFESSCAVCAEPGDGVCADCADALPLAGGVAVPPGLDTLAALFRYESGAQQLVAALKYRNQRRLVHGLGQRLAAAVPAPVGCVTWAPTSRRQVARRGFDQSELLARSLARATGLPTRRLLRRAAGSPQTGADRAHRLTGPRFGARRRPPASVLLIDDVVTTGATLSAAARALKECGARTIHGLVVAATP